MPGHEKFHYREAAELLADIRKLQLDIPYEEHPEILKDSWQIGGRILPNRMSVLPMEGCDAKDDGSPDELTERRYERFAGGGAGLLWFEATAVVPEGRANPRQLWINRDNKGSFAGMLKRSLRVHTDKFGQESKLFTVLQLTHSGRYAKPDGIARPIVAALNPWLDVLPPERIRIISDDEIAELEEKYVEAALMAAEIGFDAVDVKCCHGYLNAELLASFTRPGLYGGSFENRTRFLANVVQKIHARAGNALQVAVRMNVYDSIPYPYGWGVSRDDFHRPDDSEPVRLVQMLETYGVSLINATCGNPYYNPHVNRPYDIGSYKPPFHPLEGVATLLAAAKALQMAAPKVSIMATGFSWLRQWGVHVAAAGIAKGWFRLAGFGRQSFAYPSFAEDFMRAGRLDQSKVCLACSKCTAIMRDGGKAGCVLRDATTYAPIYRAGREGKPAIDSDHQAENVLGR